MLAPGSTSIHVDRAAAAGRARHSVPTECTVQIDAGCPLREAIALALDAVQLVD